MLQAWMKANVLVHLTMNQTNEIKQQWIEIETNRMNVKHEHESGDNAECCWIEYIK